MSSHDLLSDGFQSLECQTNMRNMQEKWLIGLSSLFEILWVLVEVQSCDVMMDSKYVMRHREKSNGVLVLPFMRTEFGKGSRSMGNCYISPNKNSSSSSNKDSCTSCFTILGNIIRISMTATHHSIFKPLAGCVNWKNMKDYWSDTWIDPNNLASGREGVSRDSTDDQHRNNHHDVLL
jgi:hypothetical protein